MNTSSRLARQLLFLANRYGKTNEDGSVVISHRFTQDELAGMIGASRSQVNRALGSLRSAAIITDDQSHCITILNQSALTKRCL
jgi:CRP/FNR family transcriptional regulator